MYETPGHSPCSISLYDEREKILVSGDLIRCEEYLFLQVPTAVLSDYAPSLRKLEKVAAENEVRWITSGHTDPYPDPSIIGELAQNMEDLEAGKCTTRPPRWTAARGARWMNTCSPAPRCGFRITRESNPE